MESISWVKNIQIPEVKLIRCMKSDAMSLDDSHFAFFHLQQQFLTWDF